jgi:RNA polymerase sigma-70 factor (ECF subfamily)
MYQIARNARTDYFHRHTPAPQETALSHPSHHIDTPARQLEEVEERALLQCALMQLSESNRELLILARYQEMKYEDIAVLFGVDTGAIKVRVHRAVKELREVFLNLRSNRSSCSATTSEIISPTT